jgi:zinc protease
VTAAPSPSPKPSRKKGRPPPERAALPGGAALFVESSHSLPIVSIVLALRSGSAHDPDGKDGLARVTARMLRRGCEGMTSTQIDDAIDSLGAELGFEVSASQISVHGQVIRRNLDRFVDLLAKLVGAPTFAVDELDRLKRESIAEIVEARDNDRALCQIGFRRSVFGGHPYGRGAGGRTVSIARIGPDDVRAFYARHFVRGNVVLGFSGDVTAAEANALGERLLARVHDGSAVADPVSPPPPLSGRRLLFVDKADRTQTQILIGGLGTWPHDADHTALSVATSIFGGTFTSRLMREVRSKRGWSYGAYARIAIERQRHSFSMWTFPSAADAAACITLELGMLKDLLAKGVTPREVAFIKRYLVRSYAFDVDTAAKRLHQALDVEILGLPADYYTGYLARTEAITAGAANDALRARLSADDLVIVVVGTAGPLVDAIKAAVGEPLRAEVVPFDWE